MLTPHKKVGKNDLRFRVWSGIFDVGGRLSAVRVVYSDESGIGSTEDEPITVVTALMLNMDDQWESVFKALEALAPKRNYEFHGARLYRDLKNGRRREEADRTLHGLHELVPLHRIPVFFAAVDRIGYLNARGREEPNTPYDIAFVLCLRQIETYVHTLIPKERVLWIADHSGHYEEVLRRADSFNARTALSPSPREKHAGNLEPHFSHLVDTVYFGNSHNSRALQLADVCCTTITRQLNGDPMARPYYPLVGSQVVHMGPAIMYRAK